MFKLLTGITKAAIGVAITPLAIVADIVSLPASSVDLRRGAFDKTDAVLKSIGKNVREVIEP